MGFFDDLTNFLNNLKPKSQLDGFVSQDFNNLLDTTEELSLDGINPLHSPSSTTDPRAISASQLDGIVQRRSGAFTQIILNPYQISKVQNGQGILPQVDQITINSPVQVGHTYFVSINSTPASYIAQPADNAFNVMTGLQNAVNALGIGFLSTSVSGSTLTVSGTQHFTDQVDSTLSLQSTALNSSSNPTYSTPISSLSRIYDIIGIDGDEPGTFTYGSSFSYPQGNWRSIPITIPGTYLKIDFLPGKLNFFDTIIDGSKGNDLQFNQLNESPNPISTGTIGVAPTVDPFTSLLMHRASNRIMFIQFDSDSAPLIPVESGDVFELTFSSFILTFRTAAPRIQALCGNNGRIIKADNVRSDKMNLYAGPGYGMWDLPHRHATPFCFNHNGRDVNGAQAELLNANTSAQYKFFENRNTFGSQKNPDMGIATGWITSLTMRVGTQNGSACQGNMAIFVRTGIQDPNGNFNVKMLYSLPFITSTQSYVINHDFGTPIRFSLRPSDSLQMIIYNESSTSVFVVGFSIMGYIYGRSYSLGVVPVLTQTGPFGASPTLQPETLTTAPFPLDLLFQNS